MYHVLEISWPELLFPLWSFSYKHVIILIVLKDSLVARNLCSGQQRVAPSVIMNMARWTTVCGRVLLVVRSCPFHLKNLTAHCSLGLVGRLEQTLHINRSWKSLKLSEIRFSMLVGSNGPIVRSCDSLLCHTYRWVMSLADCQDGLHPYILHPCIMYWPSQWISTSNTTQVWTGMTSRRTPQFFQWNCVYKSDWK